MWPGRGDSLPTAPSANMRAKSGVSLRFPSTARPNSTSSQLGHLVSEQLVHRVNQLIADRNPELGASNRRFGLAGNQDRKRDWRRPDILARQLRQLHQSVLSDRLGAKPELQTLDVLLPNFPERGDLLGDDFRRRLLLVAIVHLNGSAHQDRFLSLEHALPLLESSSRSA